ncbi:hypothetical protein LTSEUGA_2792 [Salmonella enterica subsp. enterica serovar Uganda str. R8-3404]|uniref:Uncharacterized protein n=1 Tax=Salmonella enterica subsp. enterica serovar Uganda str. R8-3404 TaxID=913083 RepID=A0A6C8H2D3_SALET|nr:hypothetical protein LTSEUGA_2792 [Salmonella enterica subsp. enterica serovar Uganda str. R8-3404]
MVAKNKTHGRRIRQSLQQLHHRCLFQQLAVSPPGAKYVSVTAERSKICFSHRWLLRAPYLKI